MEKVFKFLYYLVIVLISVAALLLIISILPITGNFKVLVVLSGSMEPKIKIGSVVTVKPEQDYKIGDIITFEPNAKTQPPITHRIYDIKVVDGNPVYITKGDANNAPDSREVRKKDVIGRVLFSIPFVGYAVEFARKPIGFMLIIIIPAAIIVYDESRKIYEEIKKRKKAKSE